MKYLSALFGIFALVICTNVLAEPIDVSGTYTVEISYSDDTPKAELKRFFGANPEIGVTLTQKGDKIKGVISDDRDGTLKGKIDDEEVTFEFLLEALGGEIKDGAGTWIVEKDGTLKGDFKIRDQKRGIVRGLWTLTRVGNTSSAPVESTGVPGTYSAEISYSDDTPKAELKWFFGANPDIEVSLTQKGDKIKGVISDDRDGTLKGKIDEAEITFEFTFESLGGELKDGAGTWIVEEDGRLKGDFKIRDQKRGIVRGFWTLTKIE